MQSSPCYANQLAEFLRIGAIGHSMSIRITRVPKDNAYYLRIPDLQLECGREGCNDVCTFRPKPDQEEVQDHNQDRFFHYTCSNCRRSDKTYALRMQFSGSITKPSGRLVEPDTGQPIEKTEQLRLTKIGEFPELSLQVPKRMRRLFGRDDELFMKGVRAEAKGLGLGAFVYYRRVVEGGKDGLYDQLIEGCEKLNCGPARLDEIRKSRDTFHFTKSAKFIEPSLPDRLLVSSHNPLTLLHNALSRGIHSYDDDQCLGLARDIRTVLVAFSQRLSEVLQESKELDEAAKHLAGLP